MTIGFRPQPKTSTELLPAVTLTPEPQLMAASLASRFPQTLQEAPGIISLQMKCIRGGILLSHLPEKGIEVCQQLEAALNPLVRALHHGERETALKNLFPVLIRGRDELGALTSLASKLLAKGATASFVGTSDDVVQQSFNSLRSITTACEQFSSLVSIVGAQAWLTPDEWVRLTNAAAQFKGDAVKSIGELGTIMGKRGVLEAFNQNFAGFEKAVQMTLPTADPSSVAKDGAPHPKTW
jgi:hypothetical protein